MITTFIITPMTFLGGVFYPISSLPEPWRTISLFNPMLYFIDFMRFSILGISYIEPQISISVAIISNIIMLPVAIFLFNQRKRLTLL